MEMEMEMSFGRLILSFYMFVVFVDMIGFIRVFRKGRAIAEEKLRNTVPDFFKLFSDIRPKDFVRTKYVRYTPFVLFCIVPVLNLLYAYMFILHIETIEAATIGPIVQGTENAFKQFCLCILKDSEKVEENKEEKEV